MATDIHTLAGAYALDAVTDIERAAFDRHVAECPSCAQELAELRETVARLTDSSSVAPPASMKHAVLATAARTRQVSPSRLAGSPAGRRTGRGWRGWMAAAAAAVVIALGAGLGGYAIAHHGNAATTAANPEIARIVTASDARLEVTTMPGGSAVSVIVSPSLNEGVAILSNMPKVRADQSYQLWLVHGTTPVSAGVMAAGATSGTRILTDVRGAGEFAISVEPAGGAAAPGSVLASVPI
jgi:anti-sigma-K factor RskA